MDTSAQKDTILY